jgi:hypothetical protein
MEAAGWLPIGALGLYLYDSALLLYDTEAIVVGHGTAGRVARGSDLLLGGRRPCFPASLTSPVARVHWDLSAAAAEPVPVPDLARFDRALRPFRIPMHALGFAFFALLPAASLAGGPWLLLGVFALIYATIAWLVVLLARQRTALGLDPKALRALSIDIVLCAPFALNLVAKLGLRRPSIGDPLAVVHATLVGPALARGRTTLRQQLEALKLTRPDAAERLAALLGSLAAEPT